MEAGIFKPTETGPIFRYDSRRILTLKEKGDQEGKSLQSDDIIRISYNFVEGKGLLLEENGDYHLPKQLADDSKFANITVEEDSVVYYAEQISFAIIACIKDYLRKSIGKGKIRAFVVLNEDELLKTWDEYYVVKMVDRYPGTMISEVRLPRLWNDAVLTDLITRTNRERPETFGFWFDSKNLGIRFDETRFPLIELHTQFCQVALCEREDLFKPKNLPKDNQRRDFLLVAGRVLALEDYNVLSNERVQSWVEGHGLKGDFAEFLRGTFKTWYNFNGLGDLLRVIGELPKE